MSNRNSESDADLKRPDTTVPERGTTGPVGMPAADAVDMAQEGVPGDAASAPATGAEGEAAQDLPAAATGTGMGAAVARVALELLRTKRGRLILGVAALSVLVIAAIALFIRYLLQPGPLPDLLPLPGSINYRPHYLFSIYGVEKPVGVAVSPDDERIYVTEMGGQREVKIFDRDGDLLGVFSPPYTEPAERAPVYLAVGPTGLVFVTDRLQRAVFVYNPEGELLDALLGPDLTLSEYAFKHVPDLQPDSTLAYNLFAGTVWIETPDGAQQALPAPDPAAWAPLGVRVGEQGTMLLTDVAEGQHKVREFACDLALAGSWHEFDPPELGYGTQGQGDGELMFPNSALTDSTARLFVSDGNNGRISVWDVMGDYLHSFGLGVGESSLSLPRGIAIDERDRLHVVDAVEQCVKVYDVSDLEPTFLYAFGDWGTEDGRFNYPGDIALDSTGRVYVADRENDRIQVWSY